MKTNMPHLPACTTGRFVTLMECFPLSFVVLGCLQGLKDGCQPNDQPRVSNSACKFLQNICLWENFLDTWPLGLFWHPMDMFLEVLVSVLSCPVAYQVTFKFLILCSAGKLPTCKPTSPLVYYNPPWHTKPACTFSSPQHSRIAL